MPVNCVAIRDASLTTLFRRQTALATFRNSNVNPGGFPNGNAFFPEQFRNTISSEVPLDAKQGQCRSGCNPNYNGVVNGYGFQAPATLGTSSSNF